MTKNIKTRLKKQIRKMMTSKKTDSMIVKGNLLIATIDRQEILKDSKLYSHVRKWFITSRDYDAIPYATVRYNCELLKLVIKQEMV